jgi:Haemolymph juvenile hormone binding protein (JHBP)
MRNIKKILLLLVVGLLGTTVADDAPTQPRNELNDALRDLLEALRRQMPCGWPDAGIPPLAPLFINSTQQLSIGVENILE